MVEQQPTQDHNQSSSDEPLEPLTVTVSATALSGSADDRDLSVTPVTAADVDALLAAPEQLAAQHGTALPERAQPEASAAKSGEAIDPGSLSPIEKFQRTRVLSFLAPDLPPVAFAAPGRRDERSAFGLDLDDVENTVRRRSRRRDEPARLIIDDVAESAEVPLRRSRERLALISEPQRVKGSTRLEAKKQRRRDGREAGRRRSVVTESEFLARRESVDRVMVVRALQERIQIGVLEDGVLAEHYVARSQEGSLIGNVYLGRVQNVLPSMEAAFVDIGRGRNAVLYSGEVDWELAQVSNQPRKIENALKPGDQVLVQVTKDPVGHKGARLTSQISLPGRYLVFVPGGSMNGISRKLPDTERTRLKKILKEALPDNAGVIVRTAAEGASEEQLTLDITRLQKQWETIHDQVANGHAPQLLHSEPDMLIKIVRDVFNEDFSSMVISGDEAQQTITKYLEQVAPDLVDRVSAYAEDRDIFDRYRITEQISKALERKVWLPSGGSLVIDRTEAMTVIDVNTGKFVGSGGNLEETVTKNNLEAAEEIVRQLRLRDIGGIIVVDFIDMVLESNRDLVLRRLVECLSRDRTKHQVAEVTSLGLVQMTRKKLGLGLLESFSDACDHCAGRGVVVQQQPVEKHRSGVQDQHSRRRKNQNQQAQQQAQPSLPQPHALTDHAKHALAQIAASTIATNEKDAQEQPERAAALAHEDAPAQSAATGAGADGQNETAGAESAHAVEPRSATTAAASTAATRGRGRGSRRVSTTPLSAAAPAVQEDLSPANPDAPAEHAVVAPERAAKVSTDEPEVSAPGERSIPVLDLADLPLPTARVATERPKVSVLDAQELLGSVLDALPEAPAPGQSKARRRRVSTSMLQAGVRSDGAEAVVTAEDADQQ